MSGRKLFATVFLMSFFSTAALCILLGYPLIFSPVNYGAVDFFMFGILITALCVFLVYVTLPFLKFIKRRVSPGLNEPVFYLIGTLLILQAVTLILGYSESYLALHKGDAFYYYKGAGNSLVYVLTGNVTAIVAALLYAAKQVKLQALQQLNQFTFDSPA